VSRRLILIGSALATALLFSSTLTTGALWRASVSLDGGDLSSGSLVLLNGNATSQVENYAFTALTGSNLRPGSTAQAPLTMKNGGSSPLGYRLSQTSTTGSTTLPTYLTLRIDTVAGEPSCTAGVDTPPASGTTAVVYSGALVGASSTGLRPLAAAATETLCVRVGVSNAAPASVQADATQVSLTFAAVSI
jgi:hypothetical protein